MTTALDTLRELRIYWGTTFNQTFGNAATSIWSTSNATKIRFTKLDLSALEEKGIEDMTVQTRLRGAPPSFPGIRSGSLKFSTYLGGGSSTTTADPYATMISKMMGGLSNPSAKYITLGAGSTNSVINITGSTVANGQGILIGGEARIISNASTTLATLNMELSAAPAESTNCTLSHVAYFDEAETKNYADWLAIGKADADQRQGIACQGTFEVNGLEPGQAPEVNIDLKIGDHQWAPAGSRSVLSNASVQGNDPPTQSYRKFYATDAGAAVSLPASVRAGKFTIKPGVDWDALQDYSAPNGVGDWIRKQSKPTASFAVDYDLDMPGLYQDFTGKTAKQVTLQLGNTPGKCVMFYMPKFYIDGAPKHTQLGATAALQIDGHADDNYTSDSELKSSSLSIHWF